MPPIVVARRRVPAFISGPWSSRMVRSLCAATATAVAGLVVAPYISVGQAQASGPAAAYAFSQGSGTAAADLSGNGNGATVVGASWLTSGRFMSALSFDGVNDGVSLPVNPSLELTNAFTVQAWIRLSAGSTATRLIAQLPGSGGDGLRVMGDGRLRFGATLGGVSADASSPSAVRRPVDERRRVL